MTMRKFMPVALATMFLASVSCFVVPPLHEVKPVLTTARELISINRDDLPGVMTDSIFDPLALSKGLSDRQVKRYREAELKHGRVAMLAATGLLVQEVFHPLFGGNFFGSPIYYFQEIQNIPNFVFAFVSVIAGIEFYGIQRLGWRGWALDDDVIPGDLGFDPMGLNPDLKTPQFKSTYNSMSPAFKRRRTQELNNGRLAMIAVVGIVVQELVTHKGVFPGTV